MRFAVFFHVFMLSLKVNSIAIFNFHWELLYIVDMSECKKGVFREVKVSETSAAATFSGDFYIFAKYAPVFSNRFCPTTLASHRHCHVRTYVHVITPPHPTPPHPTPPLRDVTHLQRSMTYVCTCK